MIKIGIDCVFSSQSHLAKLKLAMIIAQERAGGGLREMKVKAQVATRLAGTSKSVLVKKNTVISLFENNLNSLLLTHKIVGRQLIEIKVIHLFKCLAKCCSQF